MTRLQSAFLKVQRTLRKERIKIKGGMGEGNWSLRGTLRHIFCNTFSAQIQCILSTAFWLRLMDVRRAGSLFTWIDFTVARQLVSSSCLGSQIRGAKVSILFFLFEFQLRPGLYLNPAALGRIGKCLLSRPWVLTLKNCSVPGQGLPWDPRIVMHVWLMW